MRAIFSNRFLLGIFLLVLVALVVGFGRQDRELTPPASVQVDLNELKDLSGFDNLSKFFEELADSRGAEYAFKVLAQAELPPGTDSHLLGHAIGDVLYKQQGADGIKICTQDFRNACSHSIVVGLLIDKGEPALADIAQACRQAPGGSGAYTMCFHGLGHGVLSYMAYDIEKAIPLCLKTGTVQYNFREGVECIGGMIMESISGGFHDLEVWSRMRPKFLDPKNPTGICEQDYMPDSAKGMCYTYITPYLYEAAGADIGNPGSQDFARAFRFCDSVPNMQNRLICYGAFGKEFTTLANNRDVRGVDRMTTAQLQTVYDWCQLAENPDGIKACLEHAVQSLYWGGENSYQGAINLCSVVTDTDQQSACFQTLIGAVGYYRPDPIYRVEFCGRLPEQFRKQCTM